MKMLELFAGSRSVGKVAKRFGIEVFSVDIKPFDNIDMVTDIEFLSPADIPFVPDIIWASPDCTTYSIAGISHHRNGIYPISEYAEKSDRVLENTLFMIKHYLKINPALVFFIENPVGMMRKMPVLTDIERTTVTYCKYGDMRMKPTDIWSNNIASLFNMSGWRPLPKCYNGNKKCHHEAAPRGSRTGTQGIKGDYERSKIPELLIKELILSIKQQSLFSYQ